jgi:hypothetical protein
MKMSERAFLRQESWLLGQGVRKLWPKVSVLFATLGLSTSSSEHLKLLRRLVIQSSKGTRVQTPASSQDQLLTIRE